MMLGEVLSENDAPMHKCDSMWLSFMTFVTPGTNKDTVQQRFASLYVANPEKAFKLAMRFGNLRQGGFGTADMQSWLACMEVVWAANPRHIVVNIRNIMLHVSCKWALTLLKHFSNPSDTHRNNYWGNLLLTEKQKEHRMSYRVSTVLEERKKIPLYDADARKKCLDKAQEAADNCELRRKKRFDAHVKVLEEFVEEHVRMPGVIDSIFQILQPKPMSLKTKTFEVRKKVWIPRSMEVGKEFAWFQLERARREELEFEQNMWTFFGEVPMLQVRCCFPEPNLEP
jgi:hypothetical protein